MLTSLYIKNYALIDNLEINLKAGFTVITGETGAGKSIILGALSLLLGQRADIKHIQSGKNKCIIEAQFQTLNTTHLKEFCEEKEIEFDEGNFILRREISTGGKSRAFINDTPATLTQLKELSEHLIDIHSQHKNLLIGNTDFQLNVLDAVGHTHQTLAKYKQTYLQYHHTHKQLNTLIQQAEQASAEQDYIRFQYNTLQKASLQQGEQQALEEELSALNHAEEIKSALYKSYTLLAENDNSIISQLKEVQQTIENITSIYPKLSQICERINTIYIEAKDIAPEVENMAEEIEFSPQRIEFINDRLNTIYTLQQKHRVNTEADLLTIEQSLANKLENIQSFDEKIQKTQQALDIITTNLMEQAQELTTQRTKTIETFTQTLIEKLQNLGMPNIRFQCQLTPKEFPDASGKDNLQFLFSANKNTPLQPISQVASGGEISRVMLCIKSLLAQTGNLPTIIFDEIDTGVSGEVADQMGQVMKEFGAQKQVIAITHLPQIAAQGEEHFLVYKTHEEHNTKTSVKQLSTEERVKELAQMLSGSSVTDAAIENARAMLKQNK